MEIKERLLFKEKKAERLFAEFMKSYVHRDRLYRYVHAGNGDAPQHKYLPHGVKKGSLEHQIFLFFATILTYHSQSEQGFQQCLELCERNPSLFSGTVMREPLANIEKLLGVVGFIYPNATARRWKDSGATLFKMFGGKPLRIFESGSIDDIMSLKYEQGKNLFPGFGPKLFSLLALFYEELELIPNVRGAFPVDLHVQRQCLSLGIVNSDSKIIRSDLLAEFLRGKIWKVCSKKNISALDLSHAMWFLGNRVCTFCNKKRAVANFLCPVHSHCQGGVSTSSYRRGGAWNIESNHPLLDQK